MTTESFMRSRGRVGELVRWELPIEPEERGQPGVQLAVGGLALDAPMRLEEELEDLAVAAAAPGLDLVPPRHPVVPAPEQVVDPDQVGRRDPPQADVVLDVRARPVPQAADA